MKKQNANKNKLWEINKKIINAHNIQESNSNILKDIPIKNNNRDDNIILNYKNINDYHNLEKIQVKNNFSKYNIDN